jgi:manganese-dependent inorganic pyrophosphatase
VRPTYVTGHRNPDMDSVAAAIGYAELRNRTEDVDHYVPCRLGELNAQTRWALERAGVDAPRLLEHVRLRVCDVMREEFHSADADDPVREVGLTMAREQLDIVPCSRTASSPGS